MNGLAKRLAALAERFERIAKASSDQHGPQDLYAARAEGGALLKKCFEAGLLGTGEGDAEFFSDTFKQNADSPDVLLREFTQAAWFSLLSPHLTTELNPLALKQVRRTTDVTVSATTGNWRLQAGNFAKICSDLSLSVEEESELVSLTQLAKLLKGSNGKSPSNATMANFMNEGLSAFVVKKAGNSKLLNKAKAIAWIKDNRSEYQVSN